MKWFNQLWYDIKRLAGHGSLPVLVLLAPFIITGIFSTIFFPLLSEAHGANIPFAVCNDDHSEMIDVFFQYNMGKKNDIATYYPVQDMETGMKLLKEERISVLLHIPSDFYQLVDAGEDSPIYLYYLPSHEFEATMIQINLNNNLAYVGQSQNILSLAVLMNRSAVIPDEAPYLRKMVPCPRSETICRLNIMLRHYSHYAYYLLCFRQSI